MDEKPLSPEEERARLKEIYKQELLEKKRFLQRVEESKRQAQTNKALNLVEQTMNQLGDLVLDTDEWINKLAHTNALADAKMELALDKFNNENNINDQTINLHSELEQQAEPSFEKSLGDIVLNKEEGEDTIQVKKSLGEWEA